MKDFYRSFQRLFTKTLLFLFFLLTSVESITGQSKATPVYQVKSAFLYNFARFVQWPENSFASAESPFVIGVVGNNHISSFLEEIVRGEKVADHPIIVQSFESLADAKDCHILYISSNELPNRREALSRLQRSTLTVSDSPGFLKVGGMVRFYTKENKVRLQINAGLAKTANLQISSKLLNVASIFNR